MPQKTHEHNTDSSSQSHEFIKHPDIISKKEWGVEFDNFSIRFEIIDEDILHPVPKGSPRREYIDSIFDMQQKVFDDANLKDASYFLVSNLKAMKNAAMETRRYFVKKLREWYRSHPFKMIIFYHANWIMRAAISISRVTAPYQVYVTSDISDAMDLIARHRTDSVGSDLPEASDSSCVNQKYNQQDTDELLKILSGISWEAQTPESILEKVPPHHPFRQIVEAISLVKMDIDHLLTEKEYSEKALLDSNERYREILDNIEEGYYEVDLAGNLTFFNTSLCAILGYSQDELAGMNYRGFSTQDAVHKIYKTFNQVFRTSLPAKALDWKLIRKDSTERFIEASVALMKDKDNTPYGFRGIVRDVTLRVESEMEKQKLADRLRQAQKMEAVGTLAGGVAHDLNNILSGIVSYPDLLLMKLPLASPLRKPLETIKKSGERAAAIVQDLLTLARRGITNHEIVNLNHLIIDYLKSPEHNNLLIYHPMVEVDTCLDKTLLNISGSTIHIIKILMNLISNAAEAMPDGGHIHIKTENIYLDDPLPGYSPFRKGEHIKLQFKDEGIGISPEDKERIFEPFYTKKAMGRSGSGLGMALVWGAVQDHNGYIDIQSAPGAGTSVSIYFPAVRDKSAAIQHDFSIERFKGKGETVLVVDDLKDQRELAAEFLTFLGYAVHTAPSGEAAIEYMMNNTVSLIILDMIMDPGIDGLDTYKEILKINPSQKAVIATGFSTSDRIQTAQSLGAGACLKKPYLLENFAKTVREELDR